MRAALFARKIVSALALVVICGLTLLAPLPGLAQAPSEQGLELYRRSNYAEAVRLLRAALPTPPAPGLSTAVAGRPSLTTGLTPGLSPVAPPPAPPADSPETTRTRLMLGFTLLRLDQLAEAEEQFALARNNPDFQPLALLGSGWAAFARGRTSAAVDFFAEALSQSTRPANPQANALPDALRDSVPADARLGQGLIALGRGQASEAARLLQAAAPGPDLLASAKELLLALGDARAQAGDASGALSAWTAVPGHSARFKSDAPRDELARLKSARLRNDDVESALRNALRDLGQDAQLVINPAQ